MEMGDGEQTALHFVTALEKGSGNTSSVAGWWTTGETPRKTGVNRGDKIRKDAKISQQNFHRQARTKNRADQSEIRGGEKQ